MKSRRLVRLAWMVALGALGCDPGGTPGSGSGADGTGGGASSGGADEGGEEDPPPSCGNAELLLNLDFSDPAEFGEWSAPVDWSQPDRPEGVADLIPVHVMHLPTGKLLAWSGSGSNQLASRDQYTWDIEANTFEHVPAVFDAHRCNFGGVTDTDWIDCDPSEEVPTDCIEFCENSCWNPVANEQNCNSAVCEGLTAADLSCELGSGEGPDLFCAGHTNWIEGDPIIQGGNILGNLAGGAPRSLYRFIESTGLWEYLGLTPYRRWYPTITTLHDGRITLLGGLFSGFPLTVIEEGVSVGNVQEDHPAGSAGILTYPFMFQMTDGRVFYAGAEGPSSELLYDGQIFNPDTVEYEGTFSSEIPGGSAVMYAPDKVMKSGGCPSSSYRCEPFQETEIIDLAEDQQWRTSCPMPQPRHFHTLTMLPDGTVLMTGGNREGNGEEFFHCRNPDGTFVPGTEECLSDEDCCSVADSSGGGCEETCEQYDNTFYATKSAALWWPWSGDWIELGEQVYERMYHSTAMLLPDGRILSAGSGQRQGIQSRKEVEFFSPPYKFWGDAPVIEAAPDNADYGSTVSVEVSLSGTSNPVSEVHRVTMIRLGSITHQFDQDQRFLELEFGADPSDPQNRILVDMPSDGGQMVPGWTMLFVLTDRDVPQKFLTWSEFSGGPRPGVPSVGHYLKLNLEN